MGCSPYFAVTGTHPLMPMDLMEATYLVPPPDSVSTTEDLLVARARALEKRAEDVDKLRTKVYAKQRELMDRFELKNAQTMKDFDFKRGDLVLVRNTIIEKHLSSEAKMSPRYYGPLLVISRNRGGAYILCEMDGTLFHRPFAAFRLVPYYARRNLEIPTLAELLDVPFRLPEMEDDFDDGTSETADNVDTADAAGDSSDDEAN
jgi:hypothetical protein